jgi:hypothetical protein
MYQYTDGGRTQSKRPRQKGDCTVRALVLTCDLPYDDAYDMLKDAGRRSHTGFDLSGYIKKHPEINGKRLAWRPFQAVKGQPRMKTKTFIQQFPNGKFILSQAGHVSVVIDGVSLDIFESWDRCVYGVWEVT